MNLNSLTSIVQARKPRKGLGHGSGRGKTSGRGTKGQKARRKIALSFEGGAISLIKRLPFTRGKGRNKSFRQKPVVVKLQSLNVLSQDTLVDVTCLVKNNLVKAKEAKQQDVKILDQGEIKVALRIKVPISQTAAAKIIKAGGKIVAINE